MRAVSKITIIVAASALLLIAAAPADAWHFGPWGFYYRHHYPYYRYHWPGWSYHFGYYHYGPGGHFGADGHFGYWCHDGGRFVGRVDTDVKPNKAVVYLDGYPIGVADDFDGWTETLHVLPGRHELVMRYPGMQPYRTEVEVLPHTKINLKVTLVPGEDPLQTDERGRLSDGRRYAEDAPRPPRGPRFQPAPYSRPDGRQ